MNIYTCIYVHVHVYVYMYIVYILSFRFLQLEPEDLQPFISVFKQIPLKKQVSYICN